MHVVYCFGFILFFVFVVHSQYISSEPHSTTVDEGQNAYFYIGIVRDWAAWTNIVWFMNDKQFTDSTSTLSIIATREMQNAKFHAVVYYGGKLLQVSQSAYLTVLYKPELIKRNNYSVKITPGQSPPPFSADSTDITFSVLPGHVWSINLTEYIDGGNLNWEWKQDGQTLSSQIPLIKVEKGYIKSTVMASDIESSYLLYVSNSRGTVIGPRISLVQAPPPQLNSTIPNNLNVFANEYIELEVDYIDDGFTQFQWQLDNVNIPNQQSSSIRFKVHFEMRDASLTLVAVNPAGTTRQSTILRVQIPRWAIALIVILSVSFAAATVLFFLRKRGLLSNQTWMKFNKLIEIKQTIGES
jgi:hypothetical protein